MSAQTVNDGDWVEGAEKWWWKYVFPEQGSLWQTVIEAKSTVAEPEPSPWRQQIGELLAAVVMLQAASRVQERGIAEKLGKEAIHNINATAQALKTIGQKMPLAG